MLSRFSHVCLFATLWTVALQAPLSMGFSRQEYWSGLPCPPPGDRPNPGIIPTSLMSLALAGEFFHTSSTWEVPCGEKANVNAGPVCSVASVVSNSLWTLWPVAHLAPLSMGLSRQEWCGYRKFQIPQYPTYFQDKDTVAGDVEYFCC